MRSKLVLTGAIAMLLLALTAASSTAQGADVVPPLPEGYTAPVPAEAGPEASLTGIATVTTGLYHSCAVTSSHQVRCWGFDGTGALGDGDAVPSTGAVTVRNATNSGPLTNVTQVVLGSYHSCALLATHQVRCWGAGADGQLGNGDVAERHLPVAVKDAAGTANLGNVAQLAADNRTTCARLINGEARCWGLNDFAQLGDGRLANSSLPRPVLAVSGPGRLTGVGQIEVGAFHTCARLTTGQARCWGTNDSGQLGDGTVETRRRPVMVKNASGSGPLVGVRRISAGGNHTCALRTDATARCWGANDYNQLGNGTLEPSRLPVTVLVRAGVALESITHLDAGFWHACARLSSGQARCWGANNVGQLGVGADPTPNGGYPYAVRNIANTGNLTNVTNLQSTEFHTCVRLANSEARCWGFGIVGQLGDGGEENQLLPVKVFA